MGTKLYESDFSKNGPLTDEWEEMNQYTSGTFEAVNGAGVLTKGAGSPPRQKLKIGADWTDYETKIVSPAFSRLNILVHVTDNNNYIMVYVTGGTVGCGVMQNGTWMHLGNINGQNINQGDELSVKVQNVYPFVLVSFAVNGVHLYAWTIDYSAAGSVLNVGTIGLNAENIDKTYIDKISVQSI